MAVVRWDVASLPASGSERQKQPTSAPVVNLGIYFCFCSSVPYFSKPYKTRELFTDMITEQLLSILEISSIAST